MTRTSAKSLAQSRKILPQIHRTEVDGVPTFWAEGPGPMTAALMFRVGMVDEVLSQSGITHLVEHLAMHGLRERRYQMNAFVDHRRTVFHCRGKAEEVRDFLSEICASVQALPLEGAGHERNVLEAESARRSTSLADSLAMMRFGARGLGMAVYREFGLRWLTPDHLSEWARGYFTRGNAALWLSGPIPEGLKLGLGEGPRCASPAMNPVAGALPAWFNGLDGVVGMSMVGERTPALAAAAAVLDRRLNERIRHDLAMSYTPGCSYVALSPREAHLVAGADGLPENAAKIGDEMLSVLEELAKAGPTERELADHVREIERAMDEPTSVLGPLDAAATAELTADESLDPDEHFERLRALCATEVSEAISIAQRSTLLSLPNGLHGPAGFKLVSNWSDARVEGRAFKPKPVAGEGKAPKRELFVAPNGASLVFEEGAVTALFDRCVALLQYQDGGRTLIDTDGFRVSVSPAEWHNAAEALAQIDRSIPSDRHVPMPADARVASVATRTPEEPRMRRRLKKIAWGLWITVSLLSSFAMFSRPSVARAEIRPSIRVALTSEGTVDCGPGSSLAVTLHGARPVVQGKGANLVANRCAESAREMVIGSGLGILSAATALTIAARFRFRVRRERRAVHP